MTRAGSDANSGDSRRDTTPPGVASVFVEMRAKARLGEPVRAEDYVDPNEPASADADRVLDLLYAEYLVRCETEGPPPVTEFTTRFPQLADRIRRQVSLHDALESDGGTVTADGRPQPAEVPAPGGGDFATIGRYRVIDSLGRGAQATVYRGLHPDLRRDVVIKLAHRTAAAQVAETLRAEARLLATLDHPGLARIYDLDAHDGRPFIVMEYVGGRPLDVVAATPISPTHAAELVAQAALAIAHAHRHGAIHCDLKPENVLVDDAGRVRVIDFGLAKLVGPADTPCGAEGSVTGTIRYMAPEQARGRVAAVGPKADVFGLGGVLYFLLTGSPLYPGSVPDALRRATAGDWDRTELNRPDIPPRLRRVCEKALAPDPTDRYASADALAVALRGTRRRPRWAVAFAACWLIVGLTLGGWWLVNLGAEPPPLSIPAREPTGPPAPPQTTLRVRVWDDDHGRYRELVHMTPLSTGRRLRYEATAPPGRQLTLFAVDPTGEVRVLPSRTEGGIIRYPADPHAGSELVAPGGTVVVLVCGRAEGAVAAEDVRAAVGANTWPVLPRNSVVVLERGQVFVQGTMRSVGPPTDQPDPEGDVVRRLDAARIRLSRTCDVVAGVAFAHR